MPFELVIDIIPLLMLYVQSVEVLTLVKIISALQMLIKEQLFRSEIVMSVKTSHEIWATPFIWLPR